MVVFDVSHEAHIYTHETAHLGLMIIPDLRFKYLQRLSRDASKQHVKREVD